MIINDLRFDNLDDFGRGRPRPAGYAVGERHGELGASRREWHTVLGDVEQRRVRAEGILECTIATP